jgi:hypothetical protein
VSSYLSTVVCSWLIVLVACVQLLGQDAPATSTKPPLKLKDAEIKALGEQLGVAKEADREAAKKKLLAAGMAVIPAMGDIAEKGNRTATNNAIEILKSHVEGADPEARMAAFVELRKLATGSRSSAAGPAKKLVEEHKELRAEADAAWRATLEKRKAGRAENPSPPPTSAAKTNPRPMPTAPADPATALRRQGIEQSLKDAETAIEKIKKLKLPKQLENEQIAAINQSVQKLRSQLKELDGGGRKK